LFPAPADLDARTDCANRSGREAAAAHGAAVVDLADYVCPDGQCLTMRDGVVLRPDGVHFTKEGATLVARWLVPQLVAATPA
jgi:lysophospholipase L1-like esterase